jgi:translocation and assembly module TamA
VLLFAVVLLPGQAWAQPVVDVEVKGVNDQLRTNILLFLSIEQQKNHPLLSDGRIRRLHEKAGSEIAAALHPFGYYRPQITSSLKKLAQEQWQAVYDVDPGPAMKIAVVNLDITGPLRQDPALQRLIDANAPRPGEVLNHSAYDTFKSRLSGLASERGYVQARFTEARLVVDLEAYEARIFLSLESGPRYRFGEVSMQQDILKPDLLQRYVPFQSGDPYDLNQVIELQQALNDSDYFQVAEVSPGKPIHDSMEIPVQVKLEPRKPNRYDLGLGYGTDTGARAKFGWRMPRVNRSGHRIDTRFVISEIGYDASANYRVPIFDPRTDQLVYSISKVKENSDSNDSVVSSLGVSLNHNRDKWRETLKLNYQRESYKVADTSGDSVLLIPSAAWSRTWGNDFINVLDGLRFDIAIRGGTTALVSDTDFAQALGAIKFIYSLDAHNRLLMRGSFGTTETQNFEQLPSSIRFFAGGSQSVRGYAYESLGPTNDAGDVIGGRHLLTGSAEFEHYFGDRWGVAAFIDAGNAINNLNEDLEQGAGFGLRWKSPVGPVRIDLAYPISSPDLGWRLHISIGPDL